MQDRGWRSWVAGILGLGMLVLAGVAGAAPRLSIAPSGSLSGVANVPIVITVDNPEGLAVRSFKVLLNGLDVTAAFAQAARVSTTGTSSSARVDYLFAPGNWSVEAQASFATPTGLIELSTTAALIVPGDAQERRKAAVMDKVRAYINHLAGYQFTPWISLGDPAKFQARINDSDVQVYVDPVYLSDNQAEYVEKYWFGLSYYHDLVIRAEPELYSVGGTTYSAQTLWHEMVHAISHGAEVAAGAPPLPLDDHAFLGRVEACIAGITNNLTVFDDFLRTTGKNPTAAQAAQIRPRWKQTRSFCKDASRSAYASDGYPTDAQMAALKSLTGISLDIEVIRQGYLAAGYSPLYFADFKVSISSPASGAEVSANQVVVTASFENNEPDLEVSRVGFLINGSLQEAPRAGNTFQTTAVLRTGDNTIVAVVATTDGQVFASAPVAVKSNALNNTYHIRISWDKNDTDVDLHFTWNGNDCYYGNKTPTWGSAATSPKLDVDDINGFGPENITINALPGPGTYRIWVYYYGDHGNGATNVYASIYKDGVALTSSARQMSHHESWTLLEFTVP